MILCLVPAVAGRSVVAGRVDGEIVARSEGKNFDLNRRSEKMKCDNR